MYQDFAIGIDQKGVTHAVEIQRVDAVGDGLQGHVGADHTQGLRALFYRGRDGNDHLSGGSIYIGFGQAGAAAVERILVPGPGARVVAVRHLAVRANGKSALAVTKINRHKGTAQGFLFQQAGHLGGLWSQGDGFSEVLRQQDPATEPGLNVIGRDTAHLVQVVVQVVADGVALQVVVIQRK